MLVEPTGFGLTPRQYWLQQTYRNNNIPTTDILQPETQLLEMEDDSWKFNGKQRSGIHEMVKKLEISQLAQIEPSCLHTNLVCLATDLVCLYTNKLRYLHKK
ncbi:Hypothetical_protein [Hexamita inflata]|uniref:Hypothetical_protein n=1 Tax=Hexamita inflata TaxID=28002 RepID=A0AA86RE30_9EUKA|nr:Hypothetical protein HINF_LOCUS59093 [Hexamita inflata]